MIYFANKLEKVHQLLFETSHRQKMIYSRKEPDSCRGYKEIKLATKCYDKYFHYPSIYAKFTVNTTLQTRGGRHQRWVAVIGQVCFACHLLVEK